MDTIQNNQLDVSTTTPSIDQQADEPLQDFESPPLDTVVRLQNTVPSPPETNPNTITHSHANTTLR